MVNNTSKSWRCGIQLKMLKRIDKMRLQHKESYILNLCNFRCGRWMELQSEMCLWQMLESFMITIATLYSTHIKVTNVTTRRNTCCVISLVNMLLWCWQFGISLKHVDVHHVVSKMQTMIGTSCAYDIFIMLMYQVKCFKQFNSGTWFPLNNVC